MKIINCIPNVSEGRDQAVIAAVADAVRKVEGVRLVCVAPDIDHNRTVYSFVGEPAAALEAAKRLADAALARIDMSKHVGGHPRIGALDVVPFVPVGGVCHDEGPAAGRDEGSAAGRDEGPAVGRDKELSASYDEALAVCRAFGRWLGGRGVPVYYYEAAATAPGRESLADVRRGQYEGLAARLADPRWAPDEGPVLFDPRVGASAVGVRLPLIAFNVNLRTSDVGIAREIAASVRHAGGGYRHVRAMGVSLASVGLAQVSMNLVNHEMTPIPRVLETIRSEAARHGVAVAGTELVGAMPAKAIEEIMRHYLQCHGFRCGQILELNCLPDSAAGETGNYTGEP